MPGLSIIVPIGDIVTRFEDTLAAVLRNRPRACEVIVPHAGAYADPYDLASEVWFLELPTGTPHEACLSTAIDKAAGEVIHVLSPGCEFEENWWQPALAHFDDASVGSVSPLVVWNDADVGGSLGVQYSLSGRRDALTAKTESTQLSRSKVLGPTHRAGFYRRTALKQIGGWPTTLSPALGDADVALSLKQLGYRAVCEPQSRIACPRETSSLSAYQQARERERLFWRHSRAAAWPWSSMMHPLVALAECATAGSPAAMLGAMAGKFASLADLCQCREFASRLKGLKRLTVTDPPPSTGDQPTRRDDRRRRAA